MFITGKTKPNQSRVLNPSEHSRSGSHNNEDAISRLQRDTLFVSDGNRGSSGVNSEWIVSYNSTGGPGVTKSEHTAPPPQNSHERSSECLLVDDIDVSAEVDAFVVARILVSRFLSRQPPEVSNSSSVRHIRLVCLITNEAASTCVSGILLASNVLKLTCFIVKPSTDSLQFQFIVSPAPLAGQSPPPLDLPDCWTDESFSTQLFKAYSSPVRIHLRTDAQILSAVRALGVIAHEAMALGSPPLLAVDIQPVDDGTRVVVSTADESTSNRIMEVVRSPPDPTKFATYIASLSELDGSSIRIALPSGVLNLVETTNAVLRVLMAGYCTVQLVGGGEEVRLAAQPGVAELILITGKYFVLDLEWQGGKPNQIKLTRKSSTVDPFVKDKGLNVIHDFSESTSGVVAPVFALLTKSSGGPIGFSVAKTVAVLRGLLPALAQVAPVRVTLACLGSANRVTLEVTPMGPIGDLSAVLSTYCALPADPSPQGDVSPSNYRPVDAVIRYGSDDEIREYVDGLDALSGNRRFSVLLVGPRNIGLGVSLLSEDPDTEGVPRFEFISERAVRDSQNVSLKCAVRLFIKIDFGTDLPPFDELLASSAVVEVFESDSRITIANHLFTCLNEAPNANPYVLIKARGEYCAFIGVMSVVVANGWSRTIHQRVETRVVGFDEAQSTAEKGAEEEEEKVRLVYFITRLIVNTTA